MNQDMLTSRRTVIATIALGALGVFVGPVAAIPSRTTTVRTTDVVNRIDLMLQTIDSIQNRVENCESDVCTTVYENTFVRQNHTTLARTEISGITGDSKSLLARIQTARASLETVRTIVQGDIARLEEVEDPRSIGDVLALERALLEQTDSAIDAVDRLGVMPGDNITGR